MGPIDRFEGLIEGVVEGSVNRLFKSKVTLAEIQKRLESLIEEQRQIAVGKSYVPNRYEVLVNPEDFRLLTTASLPKAQAEQTLTDHVRGYVKQRGFIFGGGSARVWLNPSDDVKKRNLAIKAYTVDSSQARPAQAPLPQQPQRSPNNNDLTMNATVSVGAFPLRGEPRPNIVTRPEASIVILEYPANHPYKNIRFNKDVTIGRGLDNDIVFNDENRLSRHHARIEFKYGQFLLFDLKSTNGTMVNDRPITQIVLTPGDRISLGGLEALFQV